MKVTVNRVGPWKKAHNQKDLKAMQRFKFSRRSGPRKSSPRLLHQTGRALRTGTFSIGTVSHMQSHRYQASMRSRKPVTSPLLKNIHVSPIALQVLALPLFQTSLLQWFWQCDFVNKRRFIRPSHFLLKFVLVCTQGFTRFWSGTSSRMLGNVAGYCHS